MSIERKATLSAKNIPPLQEEAVGHQVKGGLIYVNGNMPCLLREHSKRFRLNGFGGEHAFYGRSDLENVFFSLEGFSREITVEQVSRNLRLLKEGIRPRYNTLGIEFEGSLYDKELNLSPAHDSVINPISKDTQPELNHFILERATETNKGRHLSGPTEISQALGRSVLRTYGIAEARKQYYVISSVPEAGRWEDGAVTEHVYLKSYAPYVLRHALENKVNVPTETIELYEKLGVDVFKYMEETGNLNWPMQSVHFHLGLPKYENKTDIRVGLVNAHLRMTKMNKIMSFAFSSTRHFYGQELDVKDIRAIAKRLLATTHNSKIPETEEEYLEKAINELEEGLIPSVTRYPLSGQHDRERIREDTVESIGFSATPDLRTVIAGSLFQEIQDVLAKEALVVAGGDEQQALKYLRDQYGALLEHQTCLGPDSDHEWEVKFNKRGYDDPDIKEAVVQTMEIVEAVGDRYPALKTNARIVNHVLSNSIKQVKSPNLRERLGISENGEYDPTIPSVGLVSDHKVGLETRELIEIQHEATRAQAKALTEIKTEEDLLRFYGI